MAAGRHLVQGHPRSSTLVPIKSPVGATPSTGRRRRGGRAFDGQWVAWASGVCGAERRALCDAACEIMLTWNLDL